ncbi:hypothetical protein POM88_032891 [Heracleum sosnowskyi]|uniref:SKP1 component POZ domain-containing protein n=1 Tax=Heracleum sosnowskyi TaxID=360622 RepID=A0AAD8MLQ5_9APIA|nr:hypothetical protein POM88_032891 [Heracleum sosnowskyi]
MASTIVVLQSSDGVVFDVEKRAVLRSLTIAKKLQLRRKSDHNHDSPVVLNEVKGKILEKVVDYCKHHYQPYSTLDDDFDAKFVNVDWTTFFDLIEMLSSPVYILVTVYGLVFLLKMIKRETRFSKTCWISLAKERSAVLYCLLVTIIAFVVLRSCSSYQLCNESPQSFLLNISSHSQDNTRSGIARRIGQSQQDELDYAVRYVIYHILLSKVLTLKIVNETKITFKAAARIALGNAGDLLENVKEALTLAPKYPAMS